MKFLRSHGLLKPSALTFLLASTAQAHPGHDGGHDLTWDFSGGFGHPLGGFDHLLAMVAVGLWAAQIGGRARWAVPAAFLAALAAAAALGRQGVSFGWGEQMIAASVFALGVLVVRAARMPLWAGMSLAGLFAFFHGLAHGAEMPRSVDGISYALGFLLSTALLHAAGLGLGMLFARLPSWSAKAAGAVLMLAGGWMLTT